MSDQNNEQGSAAPGSQINESNLFAATVAPVSPPPGVDPSQQAQDAQQQTPAQEPEKKDESAATSGIVFGYYPDSKTVSLDKPIMYAATKEEMDSADGVLRILPDSPSVIGSVLNNLPEAQVKPDARNYSWVENLQGGMAFAPAKEMFSNCLGRTGSKWRQGLDTGNGTVLNARIPGWGADNGKMAMLTGERALMQIKAALGQGSYLDVPLWRSGFWVRLVTPTQEELTELWQTIAQNKISFGRETYGLAFANQSVFFSSALFDFAISHVYDTSLKNRKDFRQRIDMLDEITLTWGMAKLIWPNGFYYERATTNKDGTPGEIVKGRIDIGRTLILDNEALSPWQKSHMENTQPGTMTDEAVERYRAEFALTTGRDIELAPGVKMRLRIPTAEQHIIAGKRWVNDIVSNIDKTFQLDGDDTTRQAFITERSKATLMRQYGHLVAGIKTDKVDLTIENNEEDIDTIISHAFSADKKITNKFFNEAKKFLEDSTVSIVGTPAAEEESPPMSRFPHMLPIDVQTTFFILLVQKIGALRSREM